MRFSINRDAGSNRAQRPLPVPAPIRNPLTLALFWLSKTDARLVSVCSGWAIATQAAFGVFVAFTATLAFGAMHYTLSTLNAPRSLVPWIALGWSIFILYLDREIAGSLDKTTAVVRPFLALFIGTLAAIPVEMGVFQQRIDQELERQYRLDNKQQLEELHTNELRLEQRRDDLQSSLTDLRKQETDWGKILDSEAVGRSGQGRTGVPGAGPAFQNAHAQQLSVRQQIRDVRQDLDQLEHSLPEERRRLEGQFQREEVGKIADFPTRFEAMDKVLHSSAPLYRLSWLITLALILVEMTPALLKILTALVDYHHLVKAEIRENVARIDEISDCNYRLAIENPESPEASVSEKFAIARFGAPVQPAPTPPSPVQSRTRPLVVPTQEHPRPVAKEEYDQAYLDRLCDSLLHLFGGVPRPILLIKPAATFESANAHCISSSAPEEPCTIEFNNQYLRSASRQEIENTMKHELIHAWMHFKRITDSASHGHVFIMKGREVGCDVKRSERELDEGRMRGAAGVG